MTLAQTHRLERMKEEKTHMVMWGCFFSQGALLYPALSRIAISRCFEKRKKKKYGNNRNSFTTVGVILHDRFVFVFLLLLLLLLVSFRFPVACSLLLFLFDLFIISLEKDTYA